MKKEMERQEKEKKERAGEIVKLLIIVSLLILAAFGGWWLLKELTKPSPQQVLGVAVEDQGREHILRSEWEKFSYNSNPPTSGPHDADWTKAGIYTDSQGDGYLIHSLEHGYVVIYYNCQKDGDCEGLKQKLSDLANEKRLWKLIVVPRPSLDAKIALTAWGRIDKLDELDQERIVRFIDAFRDKGPEKTME